MMGGMKEIRRTTVDVRSAQERCPECGDIPVTNDEVLVRFCEDDPTQHHYVFACPLCFRPTVKTIQRKNLDLLVANGCPMERWRMPKEIFEPHPVPELVADDAIDFHFLLAGTDELVGLLSDAQS